ncbi:BET1 homolog [Penaeus vannamei]|uniref:Putative BET1-like n=1 Tax=Penaeus vannamei TaxID=6689 RepID=A0A423SGW0_PENVA|nr:BET1 homolog [Penaeus vannamei]ROT63477.1 putative BET1-like [Penaeus vannamei]
MRRAYNAQTGPYAYGQFGHNNDTQHLSEENEDMTAELKDKVKALKSLTIDIGNEVRNQNTMLNDMDLDYHKSGNFLERSMKRLGIIGKGSHNYHMVILFAFCFLVFLLLWLALKFR